MMRPRFRPIYSCCLAAALVVGVSSVSAKECPPCGPLTCLDDPSFPKKLQDKKTKLAKEYPGDLVKLLDANGPCQRCVEISPDGFTMFFVESLSPPKFDVGKQWTAELETKGKESVDAGRLKECYVIHARERCKCCGEAEPEKQPDWNSTLSLNMNLSRPCQKREPSQ